MEKKTLESVMKEYGYVNLKCQVIGNNVFLETTAGEFYYRWKVEGDVVTLSPPSFEEK